MPDPTEDKSDSTILSIEGMTCASCAARIERKLKKVPGVKGATVNFASQRAYVRTEGAAEVEVFEEAVRQAGYSAKSYKPTSQTPELYEDDQRRLGWRLVLAVLFTAPFFFHHFLIMIGAMTHLGILPQLALAAPVFFIVGWPFHQATMRGLVRGEVTMDTLVTLGTSAAFFGSFHYFVEFAPHYAGTPEHLYFDASSMIILFVTLGRYLEVLTKRKANRALELLMDLQPRIAHVIKETHQEDLPVEMVVPGDTLSVRPGEAIPVDGYVKEGKGWADESLMTGESLPVEKRPGEAVFAGTLNGTSTLNIKAREVGEHTALAQVIRMVEEAQGSKAPVQRLADRVAAVFVPVVLVLALLTFALWVGLLGATAAFSLQRAVAVLVVACPCALGLATPIALMAGIGVAARRGILIRKAEVLEKTQSLNVLLFDKTGTLTEGKPRLVDLLVFEGEEEEKMLRFAGALELGTNHPLAAAVLKEVMVLDLILPKAEKVEEISGAGLKGLVEGHEVAIGTKAFIESLEGVVPSAQVRSNVEAYRQGGQTVSLMTVDQKITAILVMEDPPRSDSKEVVQGLKALGLKIHLLTGDGEVVAQRLGERVGVDVVKAGMTPEGKLGYLRELQAKGLKVAMVGDGYNDAAVLTAADLGVAVGSAVDAAKEAGDMVLTQGGLHKVIEAIHLSRAVFSIIRQNLFWAFAYNLLALPLAAIAPIPPAFAAGAMALSSVTVVLNALRLYGKKF
jgi:Cu+-exporting ATPase